MAATDNTLNSLKGGWLHLHPISQHPKPSWWLLTAMAGGSSVATVRAITVEGAPWLRTSTAMFAVAGRAPERHEERDTKTGGKNRNLSVFPLKSSRKILVSDRQTPLFRRCWEEISQENSLSFKQECGEKILINIELPIIYIKCNILSQTLLSDLQRVTQLSHRSNKSQPLLPGTSAATN